MRLLLACLFCLLYVSNLWATHIVGGEITYRCLGDSTYEITLSVYRDCYNGEPWFDDPAAVGVFDQNWGLVTAVYIPYLQDGDDTLDIQLSNPCLIVPPDVCVHRFFYRDTLTLPFLEGGYTLVYQRCCRNKLIRNLPAPLDVGSSYTAYLSERTLLQCNNAAVFKSWPPVAICIHQPVDFDHSATDADGDSLVYRLCTPVNGANPQEPQPQPPFPGPYEELIWQPPYHLNNLLGGVPLTLDAHTGLMTGIPNTIGNFVVGVCVDEYRADSIISTTRRDFQFNVSDCGQVASSFFTPQTICDSLQVQLNNLSQGSNTFQWYFDWEGDRSLTSTLRAPAHTYADTGSYVIALIASPNEPCRDTSFQTIHLTNGAPITVTATPDHIEPGQSAQLQATIPAGLAFTWSPVATLSNSSILDPVATPPVTTVYTIIAIDSTSACPLLGRVEIVVRTPTCQEPYIFFPTGFSPNGDGENDALKLEGNFVEEAYWAIFNRWGEKVFEATSINDAWDGTFQGRPLPAETYGYYLRIRCTDGQMTMKKGNVTLLR